jgi:hypothetical protein
MQFRKGTEKIKRDIETAAAALGFSRRGLYARLAAEVSRYCPLRGKPSLSTEGTGRARFLAVANLHLLMMAERNIDREIGKLRRELVRHAIRTRKLAARAAA